MAGYGKLSGKHGALKPFAIWPTQFQKLVRSLTCCVGQWVVFFCLHWPALSVPTSDVLLAIHGHYHVPHLEVDLVAMLVCPILIFCPWLESAVLGEFDGLAVREKLLSLFAAQPLCGC
jgi:hypothetical protein